MSENVALFVPAMHAQLSFNTLAGTDMVSHLNFLNALTEFHKNLRLGFYTNIFDNATADAIDWANYEAKFYTIKRDFNWVYVLLPTLLITIIIGVFAILNLRRV